ncbi:MULTISPECIES: sigma factor-like helix-turn-helix DNA-binding protein [Streptomyces]|uniref:RNA polymerase subunit sigma-70 n=1 Tax=Streptomyces venezuelae TaxID=54571 RepID=A0A5P2AZJ9_STRVZ|nr:sigma factor-like helix-turn-helix DNA-binding protein [Streptomyces venezuelae]QES23207.1 RNA polymerase subunit sigma-70 [Streptomyces venezuelae]
MHDDMFLTALARRFDADQELLRGLALHMTGSRAEADDVLAAARAELGRDGAGVLRAWLAAHVGLACARGLRERMEGAGRPGGGGSAVGDGGRGQAPGVPDGVDSVWLALLVALEALGAEERLAYVLHDLFGLPPEETARVTGGSPVEVARHARHVRERMRGGGAARAGGGPGRQRAVVERFLAAARARDARALAAVLAPDVVAYSERGPVHGAPAVAEAAAAFARLTRVARPALVDGSVGLVAFAAGVPVSAVAFALRHDRIAVLDITTGEDRVRALDLAFPDD